VGEIPRVIILIMGWFGFGKLVEIWFRIEGRTCEEADLSCTPRQATMSQSVNEKFI
jgi:hypothetical protein